MPMEHHPLRLFRLSLGLSQDALAERSGESKSKISRIENGHQDADLRFVRKVMALSNNQTEREALMRALVTAPSSVEAA